MNQRNRYRPLLIFPRDDPPKSDYGPPEEAFYDMFFSDEELAEYLRLKKPILVFELASARNMLGRFLDYYGDEEISEETFAKAKPIVYNGLNTINIIRSKINEEILDWTQLERKVEEVMRMQRKKKRR